MGEYNYLSKYRQQKSTRNSRWVGFWLMLTLITTLLPYRFARSGFREYAYLIAGLTIVIASAVFISNKKTFRTVRIISSLSWQYYIYVAFLFFSQIVSFSQHSNLGLDNLIWAAGYILFGILGYFLFAVVVMKDYFEKWLQLMIGVALISSLIAIYVAFTGATHIFGIALFWNPVKQVVYFQPLRIYFSSSIFFEANRFAMVVFLGLLSAFYFFMRKPTNTFVQIIIVICMIGIFLSWSRAVYLSVFISGLVWLWVEIESKRQRILLTVGMLLGGYIIFRLVMSDSAVFTLLWGQKTANRDILWASALRAILDSPFWGYGIGEGNNVLNIMYHYGGLALSVHSTPLSIAFSSGIPGTFLWAFVIIISFIRATRSKVEKHKKAFLLAGVSGTVTAAMFLDYNLGGASYGTFLMAVLLGAANLSGLSSINRISEAEQLGK